MTTDECKTNMADLNGTDQTACIGTGYMEFGDYYNPGFEWPGYSLNPVKTNSFWENTKNAWEWSE